MTERKKILLRLDPAVHDAIAKWAADELRSTNAQIEFLLRRSLGDAGRMPGNAGRPARRGRPPRSGVERSESESQSQSQSQSQSESVGGDGGDRGDPGGPGKRGRGPGDGGDVEAAP